MKKYIGYLGLALLLFVTSCTKEDDTGTNVDARDKLVGTWLCTENSKEFGTAKFSVTIKKSTSDNVNIIINSFYQITGGNAFVGVSSTNLNILSQIVGGFTIVGSGSSTAGGSSFTLNYTADNGQKKDVVTDTFTKQ